MKKLRIRTIKYVLLAFGLATTAPLTASEQINLAHQQLLESAKNYVFQALTQGAVNQDTSLSVEATPLDTRIVIPECQSDYVFSASDETLRQSNITVRAECPDNDWYLYLMVKAVRIQPVVVLTRAMSPGAVLNENSVKLVMMDKNLIRTSTFSDVNTVLGARLKKRSRPGQPIVPGQLCFVCKGDSIVIIASGGGVNIKASGIAQQDGNLGDTIAVKNSRSQKLVHAQVVDTRQVEVQI
ncbi:flagellar basal body P-ring formation chaperone FlgA [Aliiglaciecola litoralis]|uniref:Flagella basal body P-ring formation protein FlgA n=1 Tax=Aliiglaciecola litoralis TaxID=582857 RepID=A0ABP3WWF4_9ALTE